MDAPNKDIMRYLDKYKKQKYNAKSRNIEWLFTYETWYDWWKSTGKLNERGVSALEYCMCRIRDTGPYSPQNVYCATNSQNAKDAFSNGKITTTWSCISDEKRKIVSSLGGKAAAAQQREKAKTLAEEQLYKISHIDKTSRGWVKTASEVLCISHTQVRRLVNKYYNGAVYIRKSPYS